MLRLWINNQCEATPCLAGHPSLHAPTWTSRPTQSYLAPPLLDFAHKKANHFILLVLLLGFELVLGIPRFSRNASLWFNISPCWSHNQAASCMVHLVGRRSAMPIDDSRQVNKMLDGSVKRRYVPIGWFFMLWCLSLSFCLWRLNRQT
jgi:hypothetical protein